MDFTKIKSIQGVPCISYDLRRELWLLTYASNSCKLVHELCNFAISGSCQEGDTIYTGIINAIYVSYGRPFHWCRNIGRLTEIDIPSESIALHKEIIHLRDKLYAHKDLDGYQIESEIFNTVKAVVLGGRISMISNELIPRGPIITSISEHVRKLVNHFDNKAKALLNKLRGTGWPTDGEYILNMDAFSDDIFIAVPESAATALVKRMAEPVNSADGKGRAHQPHSGTN